MDSYYGMRRKRNIKLRSDHESSNEKVFSNPAWDHQGVETHVDEEEIELEEDYEELDVLDEDELDTFEDKESTDLTDALTIDGKPFIPKQQQKKQSFADTHVKLTTYLENNLNTIIRMLQKQGQIESITKFVNDSVKEYLINHYHNDN